MSQRWKYQIKNGLFWSFFMSAFNVLFNIKEISLLDQLSSDKFYIQFLIYTIVGIFILGYFTWKEIEKKSNSQQNK